MQALFSPTTSPPENRAYNRGMAKRRTERDRLAQGRRLVELRKAAGLSQYELAELIGEPQPNIAYWELSEKPPRSDVLPKLAEALGVEIADLLSVNGGRVMAARRGGKPPGKLRKVFEDVSKLPRRQQEKIIEFVTAIVRQYEQSKE
jgi:transcriptional regulator with XRE-family HTH domain